MIARFEIFAEKSDGDIKTGKARSYRWRLKASNGEVVCSGEGYKNKRDCETSVYRLKFWAKEGSREIRYLDDIEPSPSTRLWSNPLEGSIKLQKKRAT
jgi:uncharacterized protein YegP (UPF0339 family)